MPFRKAKMQVIEHIQNRGKLFAYRFCRKAGLKPWCSVRFAVIYG